MKRTPILLLLAALVLLGLRLRMESPGDLASGLFATAPGSAECERDSWRMRLIELATVDGSAANEDRQLGFSEVPWPPLFTVGLAQLTRRLAPVPRGEPASSAVRSRHVRAFVQRVLSASGVLAILAVFACARALSGGPRADLVGLLAAGAYALLPPIVFAERVGRVDPHAWSTILGCGLLCGVSLALRAKEEIDASLGGLLSGAAAGLALACDAGALPLVLASLGALLLAAARGRRDLRRASVLFVVTGAVLASMPWSLPSFWSFVPERLAWNGGPPFERLRSWPAVALLPAALIALGCGPRRSERMLLQLLALAGIGWALAFDVDSAGVHLAAVLAATVAVGDAVADAAPTRRALPVALFVLLTAPALLFARAASFAVDEESVAERREALAELEGFARSVPTPGPWLHPSARSDWRLLTEPGFAASTAGATRLPVLSSRVPGVRAGETERAAEQHARALFALEDPERFAREAWSAGVAYVALTPGMQVRLEPTPEAEAPSPPSLAARLLSSSSLPGLERVWPRADAATTPGGLVVWRIPSELSGSEQPPQVLRAR